MTSVSTFDDKPDSTIRSPASMPLRTPPESTRQTSNASANLSRRPTSFLDLPGEVRNQIYLYALQSEKKTIPQIEAQTLNTRQGSDKRAYDSPLLRPPGSLDRDLVHLLQSEELPIAGHFRCRTREIPCLGLSTREID